MVPGFPLGVKKLWYQIGNQLKKQRNITSCESFFSEPPAEFPNLLAGEWKVHRSQKESKDKTKVGATIGSPQLSKSQAAPSPWPLYSCLRFVTRWAPPICCPWSYLSIPSMICALSCSCHSNTTSMSRTPVFLSWAPKTGFASSQSASFLSFKFHFVLALQFFILSDI